MKKYYKLLLMVFFVAVLIMPIITHAALQQALPSPGAEADKTLKEVATTAKISESSIADIVALVINVILSLMGVIFLVLMVYAGFLWMTAQGEKEPVETAKRIIKQALVGLIITLAAYAISNFVIGNIVKSVTE